MNEKIEHLAKDLKQTIEELAEDLKLIKELQASDIDTAREILTVIRSQYPPTKDDKHATFDDLARQVHNERKVREYNDYREKEVKGEFIYSDFWRWCIINGKDDKNANHFAEFLKSENVTLTPLQRRHIAIKYFGYKFEYDCINDKMVAIKV